MRLVAWALETLYSRVMTIFSPPIKMSQVQLTDRHSVLHVVREDLLPGGTKQRAIIPFLEDLMAVGHHEFIYASPFCGFAQIALAYAGQHLGKKVTLFCETIKNEEAQHGVFHEFSLLAQSLGATIIPCENLHEAENQSQTYAEKTGSFLLPLGFNHELFLYHYSQALIKQFKILKEKIDFEPKVLWLPIGSGTLAGLFRQILPAEITLKCVDVRVLKPRDARITKIQNLKNIQFFRSGQLFHEKCDELPPFPSNRYYDAKLWPFISRSAHHNDIWWNVAR